MSRLVEGWGSRTARLVILGEAPGPQEDLKGEPFVGPSGGRLNSWLEAAGLSRSMCYLDNVLQYRPNEDNDITQVEQSVLQAWMAYLNERIAKLADPWVLVPTGNYALYALTGKGCVYWHQRDGHRKRPGIQDWRGSILEYRDLNGRMMKVLPTVHPAATFREPTLEGVIRLDLKRVKEQLEYREIRRPARTHFINPNIDDIAGFWEGAGDSQAPIALDIENPEIKSKESYLDPATGEPARYKSGKRKGHLKTKSVTGPRELVCIGFSYDPAYSITIPLTKGYWGGEEGLTAAWMWIRALCRLPNAKVMHNGLYDAFFLADRGIELENWTFDTLLMHLLLDPSAPHSLAFCASCDTLEPYWKHESRDVEAAFQASQTQWEAYLTYNGKDCCVTRELLEVYCARLKRQGLHTFYMDYYPSLFTPLLDLTRHGILVDDQIRRQRLAELIARCIEIQDALFTLTGEKLYATKGLSTQKIQRYLYGTLGLPRQYVKRGKGERTQSSDEVTIRKLMLQYPAKLGEAGGLILEHRRADALSKFYRDERVDHDGRFRSEYSPTTEAGRLASSKNPRGTGSNAQNVDREARDSFLCDPGCLGVAVDLSQAEARINYLLIYTITGDRALLDKARLRPSRYDQHTENAARIFGIQAQEVTPTQRYLGKKAVHAGFRGMRGGKLVDELLKDGYVLSVEEADHMIAAFIAGVPGLEEFFRYIRREIILKKYLESCTCPYKLWFTYDRTDDETYRRGYSFHPQFEVAYLMNTKGLVPLHRYFKERLEGVGQINAHVHDELFFSVPMEAAYEATAMLVKSLEEPRVYRFAGKEVELSMPCTVKVGRTWKMEQEWKQLPTREEFEAGAKEMMA